MSRFPFRFFYEVKQPALESPTVQEDDMTLATPKEHALSKKLRKLAAILDTPGPDFNSADATNFRIAARNLDQAISVLGIWKEPARIEHTVAYREAKGVHDRYLAAHPGRA